MHGVYLDLSLGNLEYPMVMSRVEKCKKTLELLHVIEEKYDRKGKGPGWIESVPAEAYAELWKLWDVENGSLTPKVTRKYASREEEVLDWLKGGFTAAEIKQITGINETVIRTVKLKNHVTVPPKFRSRMLPMDDKELIFTLSKTAITKYFRVPFTGYDPTDAKKLAKTGYKYESLSPTEALHWADIKDGALYLTEKGLFRKHGLDSYEQEVI